IITSILSFISGRLATKSNQIKQLIRNGRSASLQRTFKKSFTSFSHSTRNKTRDGLIRVRNIRALNGRFNILHELNPLFTINVTMRDIKSKNVYSRVNSKATTQWRKTESANGVHLEGVASDNRSS